MIAGLWSSVYSLGEVLGPVLGGYLMEKYDFPMTTTTFSALNLAAALCGITFFMHKRKLTLVPSTVPLGQHENIKYYSNDLVVQLSNQDVEKSTKNGSVWIEYVKSKN